MSPCKAVVKIAFMLAICGTHFGDSLDPDADANDHLTQDEADRCLEEYSPALLKKCGMAGDEEFLKAFADCSLEVGMTTYPCYIEWILNDTSVDCYNCTGRIPDANNSDLFYQESYEKCFDGCVAKRLRWLAEDLTPDVERCTSFLNNLPVHQGNPLKPEEISWLLTCLDRELEGNTTNTDPGCSLGVRIRSCVCQLDQMRPDVNCIRQLCKEKTRAPDPDYELLVE